MTRGCVVRRFNPDWLFQKWWWKHIYRSAFCGSKLRPHDWHKEDPETGEPEYEICSKCGATQ